MNLNRNVRIGNSTTLTSGLAQVEFTSGSRLASIWHSLSCQLPKIKNEQRGKVFGVEQGGVQVAVRPPPGRGQPDCNVEATSAIFIVNA